ncbi:MAG TPA: hypothetical protein VJ773_11010, partial [Gemmatimonadales bacterium]|nr:hypothetical protein [Gemmatimonadales bacterium]
VAGGGVTLALAPRLAAAGIREAHAHRALLGAAGVVEAARVGALRAALGGAGQSSGIGPATPGTTV